MTQSNTLYVGLDVHELTPQLLAQYAADGTLDDRKARIATLKQFRMAEGNHQRAIYKVRRAALEASRLSPAEAARALKRCGAPKRKSKILSSARSCENSFSNIIAIENRLP